MQKRNALMGACFGGNFDVVKLILKFDYTGEDVPRLEKKYVHRDIQGNTALHIAIMKGHMEIAKYLI